MTHIPETLATQLRRDAYRRSDRALLRGLSASVLVALPLWFLFRAVSSTRDFAWLWAPLAAMVVVRIATDLRAFSIGLRKWLELRNPR